jgi:hypothetical protein
MSVAVLELVSMEHASVPMAREVKIAPVMSAPMIVTERGNVSLILMVERSVNVMMVTRGFHVHTKPVQIIAMVMVTVSTVFATAKKESGPV